MSVVLLARHGQANFGLGTYDRLSDQGRAQSHQLAQVLAQRGVTIERIVCGDLERQRETADILAAALAGPVVSIDPAWNEYDHMPLIATVRPSYRKPWMMAADLARTTHPNRRLGEIIDEALARWTELRSPEEAAAAGLPETFERYRLRARTALDAAAAHAGTTLVVSSAGTISAAVAPLVEIPPQAWPAMHRAMVNGSVTKVVRGQRGISLISFNDHGHLEGVPGVKITYR